MPYIDLCIQITAMPLIRLRNICLTVGPAPLLNKVDLVIRKGEKTALLGRNGTGKSTLLRILHGDKKPDSGEIEADPHLKIALLEQEVPELGEGSVYNRVASGLGKIGTLLNHYHQLSTQLTTDHSEQRLNELAAVQQQLDNANGWTLHTTIQTVLSHLQLDGDLSFNTLSGGMKRRVLFAKALVSDPDLLLLDEPTNHLDITTIEWLEDFLLNFRASLLFISHDRTFIRKLATRIIELDRGQLTAWNCGYEDYLKRKDEALHAQALANARFDKKLSQEEVWIRQGIKARRTRNEGRVRALETMRKERTRRQVQQGRVKIAAHEIVPSGHKVIEAKHIEYAYDIGAPLIKDFSTLIVRGDKIGLIGPNGVGKTTLLNILLGQLEPQSGQVKQGTELQVAYFDQLRNQLDPNLSVRDNVAGGSNTITINNKPRHVMSYLQDFLFSPERAQSSVSLLSGGEKNRLLLAKLFAQPSNVLVLDEPTNDLDIETLDLLEEQVAQYTGTLLLVSHDRSFLDNVVTRTLVFTGQGQIESYIGGYTDWLEHHTTPLPVKTKKLTKSPAPTQKNTEAEMPVHAKQKLNYKERKELAELPHIIETLEAEQTKLQQQLADPNIYQTQENTVKLMMEKLKQIETQLKDAYARWETLDARQ